MGAHRHGQGGHLPTPGKVEVLSRKKISISEVSLNGLDAIGLDYFHFCMKKEACVVVLVF